MYPLIHAAVAIIEGMNQAMTRYRTLTALAMLLTVVALGGCTVNRATGKYQLNALSPEESIAMGEQAQPGLLNQYGGEIPSPRIQKHFDDLGRRLAAISEWPDLPWEFHAVNSPIINAFALPGGKIFITRGLLERLENDAQLVGVLGHEIGHVTAEHIGQQITRQQVVGTAVGVGGAVAGEYGPVVQAVGGAGGQGYLLSFGRGQEIEADTLGIRYMAELGYDPMAQAEVMKILKAAGGGGSSGLAEFLSTHPASDTRIREIEEYVEKNYPDYDTSKYKLDIDSYQKNVLEPLRDLPPAPEPKQSQP